MRNNYCTSHLKYKWINRLISVYSQELSCTTIIQLPYRLPAGKY